MKKARLILTASLLTIGAFSTVSLTSCSKDDKICNDGYEGKNCDVEVRTKFLGSYVAADAEDVSGAVVPSYTATIVANTAAVSSVRIGNFSKGYFNNDVIAATISGTTLTIDSQQPDNDGYTVSGSGSINTTTGVMTVKYTITEVVTTKSIAYSGTWHKN